MIGTEDQIRRRLTERLGSMFEISDVELGQGIIWKVATPYLDSSNDGLDVLVLGQVDGLTPDPAYDRLFSRRQNEIVVTDLGDWSNCYHWLDDEPDGTVYHMTEFGKRYKEGVLSAGVELVDGCLLQRTHVGTRRFIEKLSMSIHIVTQAQLRLVCLGDAIRASRI